MVRSALRGIDIEIIGTDELGLLLDVIEDGKSAQENARKKSLAYAAVLQLPVLSLDNALYLDNLPDDQQPGVDTRSVPGVKGRASDEQLLTYYVQRIAQLGGQTTGRWEFGACIADAQGHLFETTIVSPRLFASIPSPRIIAGYPLESIQIDPETGKYISEMTEAEQDQFWQKLIGQPLGSFVLDALA